ncbi:hypothetical protein WSK_2756 [Novosphingobium sp. Rr 2-17]|nr:hypothetical protein WSK_2756 [Novosphingobium sp. Rr 2-17]
MDLLSLLRTLGGLGVVLGLLAGALWLIRRYDLRLPGRAIGARDRRLELVETLPIDGRRMVALLRRDGREHLVLIAPEGHLILENGVTPDAADHAARDLRRAEREAADAARDERRQAAAQLATESFARLVDRVRTRAASALRSVRDRASTARVPPPPSSSRPSSSPAWPARSAKPITKAETARDERHQAAAQLATESFARLVDRVRTRAVPALRSVLDRASPAHVPPPPLPPPPSLSPPSSSPARPTRPAKPISRAARKRRAHRARTSNA